MEGGSVAIDEQLTLPNQPTDGSVTFVPLGGDGYTAPQAAYVINGWQVTGDLTGNPLEFTCFMDDRFCSLISYLTFRVNQVSGVADREFLLDVKGSPLIPNQVESGTAVATAAALAALTLNHTWRPDPMVLPYGGLPAFGLHMLNVNTDIFQMHGLIYLFNARVRELTPMGPLLWARGDA